MALFLIQFNMVIPRKRIEDPGLVAKIFYITPMTVNTRAILEIG
jgi:hypothetical protein